MKRQSRGPRSGKNSGKKTGGRFERSDRPAKKYDDDSGSGKFRRKEDDSSGGKSEKRSYGKKDNTDRPKYDRSSRNNRSDSNEDRPGRRTNRDDRKPYGRREDTGRPKYNRNEREERNDRKSERPEKNDSRSERGSSNREKSDRKPYERKERSERPRFDRSGTRDENKREKRSTDENSEKAKRPRTKEKFSDKEERTPYLKKEFREDDHFSFNKYKKEKKNLSRSAEEYNKMVKSSSKKKSQPREDDGTIRLNKFIANAGVCSRREADELIQTGVIKVNGKIVTELGTKILPTDKVQYGDQTLSQEKMVYVLLNKPKDYITTTDDPEKRRTVMELIRNASKERIYPVGRLDRNTTGILLFTNDGELAKKLTHPKYNVKKIYHVMTDQNVSAEDMQKMRDGFELEDGYVKTDDVQFVGDASNKRDIGVEIHSGRNRIVRRMFEHLGYNVVKLDRVMFAGLTKKDLPRGKWRFLTAAEVNFLKNL